MSQTDQNHSAPAAQGHTASDDIFRRITNSRRRRRWPFVLGTITIAAAAGGGVVHSAGNGEPAYRTAVATVGDVNQLLHRVATVEPTNQAEVTFPIAGAVATVGVTVGDTVSVGQTLATLDTTELEQSLHDAEQKLADAQLVLRKAIDGEAVSSLGSSSSGAPTGGTGSSRSGATTLAATSDSAGAVTLSYDTSSLELQVGRTTATSTTTAEATNASERQDAINAMLAAQEKVDADLLAAKLALDVARQVCSLSDATSATTAASTTSTIEATEESSTTTEADAPASQTDELHACRDALDAALAAQQQASASGTTLQTAMSEVDDLLRSASTDQSTTTTSTTPTVSTSTTIPATGGLTGGTGGTGANTGSTGGTAATGGTGSGGTTGTAPTGGNVGSNVTATSTDTTATAADLVAYQAAVTAAEVNLKVATQALEQATIVSPITGTVAEVSLSAGDSVSAADSAARIIVIGPGGLEASTTVTVDEVSKLNVGDHVTVSPDNASAQQGEIVAIGAASSSSGAVTYPVTIALNGGGDGLDNGGLATVAIELASATNVLTVPISAVSEQGAVSTVQVLDGGSVSTVRVQVGATSDTTAEITSGLTADQTVVLADLDEPLPTGSNTSSNTSRVGGQNGPGANVPGGANFPGGFSNNAPGGSGSTRRSNGG